MLQESGDLYTAARFLLLQDDVRLAYGRYFMRIP